MSLTRAITVLLLVGSMAAPAYADSLAGKQDDLKTMLKGKDSFFITPPRDWTVNTEDARDKGMYAYFFLKGYTFDTSPAIIYIRLMDKLGLTVADHLKSDMDYYRENNIKVKFDSFSVGELKYAYAAKKYRIEDKSCDYVCYIDPGKGQQSYLIFVLTADVRHCSDYRSAFVDMLKSFTWGSEELAPSPPQE